MVPFCRHAWRGNFSRFYTRRRQLAGTQQQESILPTHIEKPTRIQAAGNMPKIIDEYIGHVNSPAVKFRARKSHASALRICAVPPDGRSRDRRRSLRNTPWFFADGCACSHQGGAFDVAAGQAVIAHPGEWIQYSTPDEATEYIAICLPAFSPQTVHRDDTP